MLSIGGSKYVDKLRKHSKQFYNSLVRAGLSPQKARELTAEHVNLMRYLMEHGLSMEKAHKVANLYKDKWKHYQPKTRRRLILNRVRGPQKLEDLLADLDY